jgi:hypothetical protein
VWSAHEVLPVCVEAAQTEETAQFAAPESTTAVSP